MNPRAALTSAGRLAGKAWNGWASCYVGIITSARGQFDSRDRRVLATKIAAAIGTFFGFVFDPNVAGPLILLGLAVFEGYARWKAGPTAPNAWGPPATYVPPSYGPSSPSSQSWGPPPPP